MAEQLDFAQLGEAPVYRNGIGNVTQLCERFAQELKHAPQPTKHLIESITNLGVLAPIIISVDDISRDLSIYEEGAVLRAGRRRLLVSQQLGLPAIPVLYVKASEFASLRISVDENQARSENPLSDVEAIVRLLEQASEEEKEISPKQIAGMLGMPVGTVQRRMKLLNLSAPIYEQISSGKISLHVAEKLASMDTSKRKKAEKVINETGKFTSEDLRELKRAAKAKETTTLPIDQIFNSNVVMLSITKKSAQVLSDLLDHAIKREPYDHDLDIGIVLQDLWFAVQDKIK